MGPRLSKAGGGVAQRLLCAYLLPFKYLIFNLLTLLIKTLSLLGGKHLNGSIVRGSIFTCAFPLFDSDLNIIFNLL